MKVLVTGATSYLGGWVTKTLRDNGRDVIGVGSRDTEGWREAVERVRPDVVVHLGWNAAPGGDGVVQKEMASASEWLARTCYSYRVGRVVFASTTAVYGPSVSDRGWAETDLLDPQGVYALRKAVAEQSMRKWLGDSLTVLRFGSLMGVGAPLSRTRTDLVVNAFASEAFQGRDFDVWLPEAIKPVVHVRDAADVVATACDHSKTGLFNVVGECVTAGQIARCVELETGVKSRFAEDPGRGSRSCRVSNARVETVLMSHLPVEQADRPLWRTVVEAVREFRGWTPGDLDGPTTAWDWG